MSEPSDNDTENPAGDRRVPLTRRIIGKLVLAPTFLWTLILCRLLRVWPYHSAVTDSLFIGALPLQSYVPELKKLGVTAVVNMCEEYAGPVEAYKKHGIRQLHLPTQDYTCPSTQNLRKAVDFINDEIKRGRVYVHCKAGRQRSGAVILCWLAQSSGLSAHDAQLALLEARRHANRKLHLQESILEFVRTIPSKSVSDAI